MEALRLEGNGHFATDPAKAAELYQQAMQLYDDAHSASTADAKTADSSCTLEEYTKCAGNALTCLFKLGRRSECVAVAMRVLRVNPVFAKANAFIGRAACEEEHLLPTPATTPLLFLCRAVYLLPSMEEAARPSIEVALDRLLRRNSAAPNPAIGAADAASLPVEVRRGPCGNGVVAVAALDALVLVSDTRAPFSVVSYEETQGRGLCAHCGQSLAHMAAATSTLPGCTRCQLAFYCSTGCEAAHRSCVHEPYACGRLVKLKEMCAMIEARALDVPGEFFELAAHTVATVAAYEAQRPGWDQLAKLESHGREVAVNLHPTASLLHDLYRDTPALSPDFLTEVMGIVRCNALEVAEDSGMGVGQALYCGSHTLTSYFNHSCAPNCAMDSARHGIITTRAIQPGEELCISYIPQLYWPCALRQRRLSEQFYFTCRCTRCEQSSTDPFERAVQMELPASIKGGSGGASTTAKLHVRVQAMCEEVRSLPVDDITPSHVTKVQALQRELATHTFPFHYLQHELRNLLSFLYAVLGNAPACLESCLAELLMWESTVPGALPVKQMKIRNALQCMSDAGEPSKAALYPHLLKLALAYDVAQVDDVEEEP